MAVCGFGLGGSRGVAPLTLPGAPGLTTWNKKLLGAPGIATRSKDATGVEAIGSQLPDPTLWTDSGRSIHAKACGFRAEGSRVSMTLVYLIGNTICDVLVIASKPFKTGLV